MANIPQTASRCQQQLTAPGAPFELVQGEIGGVPMPMYRNAFATLPELIAAARVHGDKEFMVYEGDRWTFARFFEAVDALAAQLQQRFGVARGDRVAIMMRNRPEWAVGFVAAASIGAVAAPINSFGMSAELAASLRDVAPRVVLCDGERLARVPDVPAQLDCVAVVVGGDAAAPMVLRYEDVVAGPARTPRAVQLSAQDPALILFTSGATSKAKGVLSSQRAVCQALCNMDYIGAVSALASPERVAAIVQRGFAPTILAAVPLFHVSGLHAQLLSAMRNGRRIVFMHRWDPARALELIRSERITQFNGAPSMVLQLLAEPGFDEATTSLAGIGFGGAGLPQRAIDELLRRKPDSLSGVGFGLTESNGVGTAASGDLFVYKPRSSGRLSPIMTLRVADIDGSPLPAGQAGELWLRGASLMDGYWRDPDTTAAAMSDGWFRSGDIGYIDDEGFLFVVDRIKDVINRNGEKIAASEVESCILQHPQVLEVAVLAADDEAAGETVVAVVVPKPGAALDGAAIQAHVAASLAGYKVPSRVHLHTGPLPRNAVGKLLKSALKREYAGT
ncbi:class I adenylate-forming enzyme family protein [Massilia cavernae]|uniref:AMP-binding protein n=1 Tax=Massilia cavernae TaxID=2320864 RepID=A0A418Y0V4_9BURK|nr:class I adenylate-forming enzyme family protein [Massilia cavernae]RJG19010.1 AMP-binding protein [Massilia cavernae]